MYFVNFANFINHLFIWNILLNWRNKHFRPGKSGKGRAVFVCWNNNNSGIVSRILEVTITEVKIQYN